MREAKLRGLGVAIAVEMFNSIVLSNPELRYQLALFVPLLRGGLLVHRLYLNLILICCSAPAAHAQRARRAGCKTHLEAANLARCGVQHCQAPRLLPDKGGAAQALDVVPWDVRRVQGCVSVRLVQTSLLPPLGVP